MSLRESEGTRPPGGLDYESWCAWSDYSRDEAALKELEAFQAWMWRMIHDYEGSSGDARTMARAHLNNAMLGCFYAHILRMALHNILESYREHEVSYARGRARDWMDALPEVEGGM